MKKFINVCYGLGGAVIMIGILFKILKWENADIILQYGLLSEAVVFVIMAFDFSHIDNSKGSDWKWTIKKERKDEPVKK